MDALSVGVLGLRGVRGDAVAPAPEPGVVANPAICQNWGARHGRDRCIHIVARGDRRLAGRGTPKSAGLLRRADYAGNVAQHLIGPCLGDLGKTLSDELRSQVSGPLRVPDMDCEVIDNSGPDIADAYFETAAFFIGEASLAAQTAATVSFALPMISKQQIVASAARLVVPWVVCAVALPTSATKPVTWEGCRCSWPL